MCAPSQIADRHGGAPRCRTAELGGLGLEVELSVVRSALGGAFVITTLITVPLSTIFYTLALGEPLERAEPGSLD
jgi:hypothetical protein